MTAEGHWCTDHARAEATETCCGHRWATTATDAGLRVCRECFGGPTTLSVARTRADPKNETELTTKLVKEAQERGWLAYHPRHGWARGSYRVVMEGDKGFPDITLAHYLYGVIFAELKSKGEKRSDDQERWADTLSAVRAVLPKVVPTVGPDEQRRMLRYFLWYPADWSDILRILDGAPA